MGKWAAQRGRESKGALAFGEGILTEVTRLIKWAVSERELQPNRFTIHSLRAGGGHAYTAPVLIYRTFEVSGIDRFRYLLTFWRRNCQKSSNMFDAHRMMDRATKGVHWRDSPGRACERRRRLDGNETVGRPETDGVRR